MQVPELVSDEVKVNKGDLLTQLHPFHDIIDVDDDSHLKHDINPNTKDPYLARQLSDYLAPAMPSNVIA